MVDRINSSRFKKQEERFRLNIREKKNNTYFQRLGKGKAMDWVALGILGASSLGSQINICLERYKCSWCCLG